MRNILIDYVTDLRDRQRVALAIARGTSSRAMRKIDLARPFSWEFSGFSQNGEDGILEVLRGEMRGKSHTCLEIGAADGIQNNTSWLLVLEQYLAVMVEGSRALSAKACRLLSDYSIGSRFEARFVTRENVDGLLRLLPTPDIDVFSLDIDGNDLHIAQALFDTGLRPGIAVVEYNSVFGPERSVTIPYQPQFNYRGAHPSQLYYGVALAAWQRFFEKRGMRFLTVESHGVNAFFVDPARFDPRFLESVQPLAFADNRYQVAKTGLSGDAQFALISDCAFLQV